MPLSTRPRQCCHEDGIQTFLDRFHAFTFHFTANMLSPCQFVAIPRTATANLTAGAVSRRTNPYSFVIAPTLIEGSVKHFDKWCPLPPGIVLYVDSLMRSPARSSIQGEAVCVQVKREKG